MIKIVIISNTFSNVGTQKESVATSFKRCSRLETRPAVFAALEPNGHLVRGRRIESAAP